VPEDVCRAADVSVVLGHAAADLHASVSSRQQEDGVTGGTVDVEGLPLTERPRNCTLRAARNLSRLRNLLNSAVKSVVVYRSVGEVLISLSKAVSP